MKYQNKKNNKGFTLIEMMVAIAVFSIVMVMAMGALLNVIDSNNKARSIKTAINNISFALEGISKKMRMGTDYACGTNGINTIEQDCTDGLADIISFKVKDGEYIFYKFEEQIKSCISTIQGSCDGTYSLLTSSELTLDSVKFYVLGVTNSKVVAGIRTQPRVIIVIKGSAGNKNKVKTQTTFDLQTGISQTSRIKI
jgi:prepilin-type N-terminal cleavage/methylation domain-containing protein